LDESWPTAPRSAYARHKVEGEERVLEAGGLVVRVQWVYDLQGTSFLPTMLGRLRRRERLRLVVDQVGCPTPAELLAPRLLAAAAGGPTGLFHLATLGEARPWDWVQEAALRLGLPFSAEPVLRAELGGAERPARSCLDSRRFAERWGGLPEWREALAEIIARRG
jgi:dTDP-4-dehydrorhamnose reductase